MAQIGTLRQSASAYLRIRSKHRRKRAHATTLKIPHRQLRIKGMAFS
jgi:hypothetical protein